MATPYSRPTGAPPCSAGEIPEAGAAPAGSEECWRMLFEMAHDVNNALTVISGNVTLLLDELPRDSGAAGDVREIGDAAHRAAARIRQVLQRRPRPPSRASSFRDTECPDRS